ncbi:MAG: hypothetical protein GY824_02735, partial [Delftia sp.]|nr:hypothetical protein [Delftia sp.]
MSLSTRARFFSYLITGIFLICCAAQAGAGVKRKDVERRLATVVDGPLAELQISADRSGLRSLLVAKPLPLLGNLKPGEQALAVAAAVAPLWGLDKDQQGEIAICKIRQADRGPFVHVDLERRVEGLPVAGYPARVSLTADGKLVAITGSLAAGTVSSRLDRWGPAGAVAVAAAQIEAGARTGQPEIRSPAEKADGIHLLAWPGETAQQAAWQRWVKDPDGNLRLGWQVMLIESDGFTMWLADIDGATGRLLRADPRTRFEGPTGLVFDRGSPQPSATPGQVPPNPNPPLVVERELVEFSGDLIDSPAGWVGPEMISVGNNVI